jgi:hypothetical protein
MKFRNEGASNQAIQAYDNLNDAIHDEITAAGKKAIRKKFGYKRSPELCRAGLTVNFWKSIQSSIFADDHHLWEQSRLLRSLALMWMKQ